MFKKIYLFWKFSGLILHLFSGILLALIFAQKGIASASASTLFIWWNKRLCNLFKANIRVHGKINQQPTLYVMNHISWFDVPVLAAQKPLHFLSKSEVRSWPFIGWFVARSGTLFIQRGANGAAQKSLNEITRCLLQGGSVAFFPEGTTTDGSGLRNFHGRLLHAAIDAKVQIQPIALRYPCKQGINRYVPYIDEMTFLDSVAGLLKSSPLDVDLYFLEPIDYHLLDKSDMSGKQLAKIARQAIADQLKIDLN